MAPQTSLDAAQHPSAEDLASFGLGWPTVVDSETIAEHLANCPECQDRSLSTHSDRFLDLVRQAAGADTDSLVISCRVVRGYEVLHELGRGGAGVVFLARQPGLGRLVALKQLRAGTLASPSELIRFRREAESLARLDHPNIVRVYESGEQDGVPYVALEYIVGKTLAEQLKLGPLESRAAADLTAKIARGVECTHSAGIIHRDLKPGNILLQPDPADSNGLGIPKITDFGLARSLDTVPHTLTGALLGTPSYMAPEQISGPANAIGVGCDIFALGAILYEALTGRPPFRGESVVDTLDLVRDSHPIPPRQFNASIPLDLERICLKCLEKSADDRYPTAAALADDLQRFLHGEKISAGPVRPQLRSRPSTRRKSVLVLATLGAVLALAAVGGWWWNSVPRDPHSPAGLSVPAASAPVVTAPAFAGLTTWLRADRGTELDAFGGIRQWSDQSSKGDHDALQIIAVNRPKLVSGDKAGLSVVRFDGVDDSLDLTGQILDSQEFTILAAVNYVNTTKEMGAHSLLSNWDGTKATSSVFLGVMDVDGVFPRFTDQLGGQTDDNIQTTRGALIETPSKPFIITARSSQANAEVYINSRRIAETKRPLEKRDLSGVWRIGTQGGAYEFWPGDLAEILVYDRALDGSELKSVWKYLHEKYLPGRPP